jgi:hypothetical protein
MGQASIPLVTAYLVSVGRSFLLFVPKCKYLLVALSKHQHSEDECPHSEGK